MSFPLRLICPLLTIERQVHPVKVRTRIFFDSKFLAVFVDASGTEAPTPTAMASLNSSEVLCAIFEETLYVARQKRQELEICVSELGLFTPLPQEGEPSILLSFRTCVRWQIFCIPCPCAFVADVFVSSPCPSFRRFDQLELLRVEGEG